MEDIILNKYRIIRILKETNESCVMLAEHLKLHSCWIIKQLTGADKEAMREVEVLKGIRHPGIPMIVDVVKEEERITIIREYAEGKTLDRELENGIFSQDQVVGIGLQLCGIIRFLHEGLSKPLIFRDMKPGNIVMTEDGQLKLIDFGIARFYHDGQEHDTCYLGTKGFASPEQFGFSQSDVRTDVFGIGATLYNLLTRMDLGKPPYRIMPIRPVNNSVTSSMEAIINKACAIDKNRRYQAVSEMIHDLERLTVRKERMSMEAVMKSSKAVKIGIAPVSRGCGSTYCTLRIGRYLQGKGSRVLIVDMSKARKLSGLEYHPECRIEKSHLSFWGMDMIHQSVIEDTSRFPGDGWLERYDYVLFDSDCLRELEVVRDIRLTVVASVSPWQLEAFEEFILEPRDGPLCVCINMATNEEFKELVLTVKDLRLYRMDYVPFDALTEEDAFVEELLSEMEVMGDWQSQKGFYAAKEYRKKLAALIKPSPSE